MEEKKWYKSRTLWMNVIMGVVGIAVGAKPAYAEYLNEQNIALLMAVLNIFVRFDTTTALIK